MTRSDFFGWLYSQFSYQEIDSITMNIYHNPEHMDYNMNYQMGNYEFCKEFLLTNRDLIKNYSGFNKHSILIEACLNNDIKTVKKLIKSNVDVNEKTKENFTALTVASQYNHVAIVRLLIKAGADVNIVDNKGLTPLIWASQDGYIEVAKLLIENDADINFQDANGRTALMWASQDGYFELVKYLLDKKAKVNIQNAGGTSALTIASEKGHTEIAKLLIENKANVNLETKDGLTALISASANGNLEIVKLLLKYDANLEAKSPNTKTNKLMTALEFAMESKSFEIVEVLKNAGAKFSFKDDDINSILQKQNPETLENFIKSGNSVKDFNIYGLAYSNTNLDVIEILLKHGADVNSKSPEKNSPLNASTHNGNLEAVKLFVKYGANVNLQNNKGDTALMWACIDKQAEIVKFLLTIEKLELNLQANDGWSALMFAVDNNSVEIVELLINAKADLNLKNYRGLTALEMAKTHIKNKVVLQMNETQLKNKNKIVQLLKQAGAKE
jgi:serine/threonine-protein phosphatase 6 regulatory ankyrin repeat subunit B